MVPLLRLTVIQAVLKRLNLSCLSGFKMQAVTWAMLCLCSVGEWAFLQELFLLSDSLTFCVYIFSLHVAIAFSVHLIAPV